VQTPGLLQRFPAGSCTVTGIDQMGYQQTLAPAVLDGAVYSVISDHIFAFEAGALNGENLVDQTDDLIGLWTELGPFDADSTITTAPVLADGVLYFGTDEGLVFAVDASTGAELWRFDADVAVSADVSIVGGPAVVPSAVYVVTSEGDVIAIAGR
jgi:outer membrane protein assembly factor BamB